MPTLVRLAYMEHWARRIEERMSLGGHSPADIARACKVKSSSVSEWFGRASKTTKMISGMNLVAVAKFLGVNEEWVMTGAGPIERGSRGSVAHLDPKTLASAHELLRTAYDQNGKVHFNVEEEPDALIDAWLRMAQMTAEPSPAEIMPVVLMAQERAEKASEQERTTGRANRTGEKTRRRSAA